MKHTLSLALLLTLVLTPARGADAPPAPPAAPADDAKAVKEKLQGTWKVLAANNRGREMPADRLPDMTVTIAGDVLTIRTGDKPAGEGATITRLDPAASPAQIDFESNKADKDKSVGLFKLDGDRLEICFNKGDQRPDKIAPGDAVAYLKLERKR